MLTEAGCLERRARLWSLLSDDLEWVVVADPRHVQYFCGFRINPCSFSADQRAMLLMDRGGHAVLLADNFTRRSASAVPVQCEEEIVTWYTHRRSVINRDHALKLAMADQTVVSLKGRTGVFETEWLPAFLLDGLLPHGHSVLPSSATGSRMTLGSVIRQLRRQKCDDELELLRSCMKACDAGHAAAFDAVRAGASELDVYLAVHNAAVLSAGRVSIVYGDFRATNPEQPKAGGLPTDYRLRAGDLFIIDYSVIIDGYRSDFTNTIAVGDPSEAAVRQFDACVASLEAAESLLRSGTAARDVSAAASAVLEERGYGPLVSHCGHGLGLEHPEPPIIVPESDDVLLDRDVVTIEPGVYVPGVGGMRFEHNYAVTPDGFEQLSHHRLSLIP